MCSSDLDAGGQFTITGVSVSAGDTLSLYLDDETASGVTITLSQGATETGVHIYQDRLILRHENAGPIDVADLKTATNTGDCDLLRFIRADDLAAYVGWGYKTIIPSGMTFTPGGNVFFGSGVLIQGTMNGGSNELHVFGNWDNDGTFGSGTSTVTLTERARVSREERRSMRWRRRDWCKRVRQ